MKRSLSLLSLLAAGLAVGCAPGPAPAPVPPPAAPAAPVAPTPTPEPFYAGKTIRWIVGFAPGGGFDAYTRLIAKHIGRHIPGNPTTIVENMPGAASLVAANHIYKVAKPDGLAVGSFSESIIMDQLLGREGVEFDFRKFSLLGAADQATLACVVRTDRGIKSIAEAVGAARPLILGTVGTSGFTNDHPKALQATLGANLQLVTGYGGTAQIALAMEKGEVEGGCWTWESIKSTRRDWLERDFARIVVQQAPRKAKELAEVPLAEELAKSEGDRQLLRAVAAPAAFSKPYAMPPGVPAERVKVMQTALAATLKDVEFLAEAEKAKLEVNPVSGEDLKKIVDELLLMPPDVVKRLADVLQ